MKDIFELVYLVYEGRLETQREFADEMFISLGKVNSLLQKAMEMNYITDVSGYSVTKEGMTLLETHKVDNAIIMAAGFGSRFVPMTYETPKGLLEVKGEVLIERQIRQLHAVGITDITIIIGYLKEKFEYLSDKYNVKLVVNPEFSTKNNISSIHYAKDHFKNSYLLTSDIYMEKNLYRKYEMVSYYTVEYHEAYTEEWKADLTGSNLIVDLDPKGGQKCWAINGPTFLKQDESKALIEDIEKIYDHQYASQWYWEDVWMRNINEIKVYAKKQKEGAVIEFESLDDLRKFDNSYLTRSRSVILEIIQDVFKCDLKDIKNIETLKDGMTNESFLFEVFNDRYVFRNPGVGTEDLIKRHEEYNVYQLIKDLNISDDVIYMDPTRGYKITKYIKNAKSFELRNEQQLDDALVIIRRLHNSGLVADHDFDHEERIAFYYKLCIDHNAILFTDIDEVHENINQIISYLKSLSRPKVLCHVDFVAENLLLHDGAMTLLDWEYSGMADPLVDLSMYVLYGGLNDEEILDLLERYLERKATAEELNVLYAYIALGGFLWALWTQYKQARGEDFGTYGMEQYQFARTYSRKVNYE